MKRPNSPILTAGPSISERELRYVSDAARNGWNKNWNTYLLKFRKKFADYVGVKYTIPTSGGTGALQLALAALGVSKGDEVIIPEITYFACSDVVMLLGAKPVFVDVLRDTWCIDPSALERAITKKTKVIMPVHIYGNPAEMKDVMKIARKRKLKVLEDACPAMGSWYHGKHPGSFGDAGAFSFQGAKIMTTGIGGMFVTNDKALYEHAEYLNNHGEDPDKKFWQTSVGHSTEMSNLQAAFGLAQLERLEKFVSKKRQIFDWYASRLKNVDGILLNSERPDTKSNRWMSSIILEKKFRYSRDEMIVQLKKRMVDSRPFFYPISTFPMYTEAKTPIAHHVAANGINLPSGLNLTKSEVNYVSTQVIELLSN